MMAKTNVGLANFAKKCVGRPYIFATYGKILTEASLTRIARDYPDKMTPERVKIARKNYIGKRTDDCNGLNKNFLWLPGGDDVDINADPIYNAKQDLTADQTFERATVKGDIKTIPEIVGLNVRYPGHVGVYIGDGLVVEARGFNYGVEITRLSERRWTHWFENPFIEYKKPDPEEKIMITVVELKKGSKGPEVFAVQSILRAKNIKDDSGADLATDSSFGKRTEQAVKRFQKVSAIGVTGIVNSITWNKLING